ncbi:hypothetical protein HAX54_019663 [Datura stramonium]|uniref:Squalene monooxygenase n=1 Tax=Datura stramonium TaxID=4076 RepID=A0ABS8US02_DATST|nr:hypothetical protein [Datura stramonium]
MPAVPHPTPGALFKGDAFNMRHPLTGGGMTVTLSTSLWHPPQYVAGALYKLWCRPTAAAFSIIQTHVDFAAPMVDLGGIEFFFFARIHHIGENYHFLVIQLSWWTSNTAVSLAIGCFPYFRECLLLVID